MPSSCLRIWLSVGMRCMPNSDWQASRLWASWNIRGIVPPQALVTGVWINFIQPPQPAYFWNFHRHRTNTSLNPALRLVATSNYSLKTGIGMRSSYFGISSFTSTSTASCDQLSGSDSNQIRIRSVNESSESSRLSNEITLSLSIIAYISGFFICSEFTS